MEWSGQSKYRMRRRCECVMTADVVCVCARVSRVLSCGEGDVTPESHSFERALRQFLTSRAATPTPTRESAVAFATDQRSVTVRVPTPSPYNHATIRTRCGVCGLLARRHLDDKLTRSVSDSSHLRRGADVDGTSVLHLAHELGHFLARHLGIVRRIGAEVPLL